MNVSANWITSPIDFETAAYTVSKRFQIKKKIKLVKAYEVYQQDLREIYRNVWAAERLIVDKYDISAEEYIVAIKAYVEEFGNNPKEAHIVRIGKRYWNLVEMPSLMTIIFHFFPERKRRLNLKRQEQKYSKRRHIQYNSQKWRMA